jgi:Zn-finger nucleic acid-binding protein
MRLEPDKECLVCDYCGNIHYPEPNADGVRVLDEGSSEQCPVCGILLVDAAISGQRILYCNRCHGMLVSMDVFLAIIEDQRSRRDTTADAVHQPDWKDLDRKLKCPKCGQQMDAHPYCGPGNVIIDDCENCSVNWLDYGELQKIVRAPDRQYTIPIDDDDHLKGAWKQLSDSE